MVRSNREWLYWGATDPMWAVSTQPGRQRGRAGAWTAETLLAEGAEYIAPVLDQWRQYGCGSARCAEIGCGAGRLTAQLAGVFESVVAIDVSPDQLRLARTLLGDVSGRVTFHHVSTPEIPEPDASCDGVYSAEVFQHFSSYDLVARYLAEAYRVLAPGGTLCVNLPVAGVNRYDRPGYAVRRVRTALERAAGRSRLMEYRVHRGRRVIDTLEALGFRDVELRSFAVGAHDSQHSYFFARR